MTRLNKWIMATRPRTLFASLSPVVLGLAVALVETKSLNALVALLTALCALIMQVASNLANDYLDSLRGVDTEKRLGPTRVTHAGLIPASEMKIALMLCLGLAFLLGIYLMIVGGPVIMIIGLISLYFAYGYTGGPFPLSHNGLGEVAAFVFFGPVAVCGTTYLQTHAFSHLALMLSTGPGFISAIILAINNLRDIETDTETKKLTIAVRFGEKFQRRLCILLVLASSLTLAISAGTFHLPWLWPLVLSPLLFLKNWLHVFMAPIDKRMNQALARTAQYLLVYCLLTSIGLILSFGLLW